MVSGEEVSSARKLMCSFCSTKSRVVEICTIGSVKGTRKGMMKILVKELLFFYLDIPFDFY